MLAPERTQLRRYDYRSGAHPVGDGLPLSTNLYDTEEMVS